MAPGRLDSRLRWAVLCALLACVSVLVVTAVSARAAQEKEGIA